LSLTCPFQRTLPRDARYTDYKQGHGKLIIIE